MAIKNDLLKENINLDSLWLASVGNGNDTKFWIVISDSRVRWVWDWARRPNSEPARSQFAQLQAIVDGHSPSMSKDTWKWLGLGRRDGSIFVSSALRLDFGGDRTGFGLFIHTEREERKKEINIT
ncbi:hypothetical protein QVD17_26254 [Tagetes erecta]|uniref:Uncharacterized protein n=1 Tax=Tagetes erecta TaxID=13708 RepID=A0AAD8KAM1_TARER|nr:hypothetical protein QVD17_26254 [Tagetes erecta]